MPNKSYAYLCGILFSILLSGCAMHPPQPERVILLPQIDSSPSAVVVQAKAGGVAVLDQPYTVATILNKTVGSELTDETSVKTRYKDLYDALPARPKLYLLFFDTGGIQLTAESEVLLQTIIKDFNELPSPELVVIGHTDAVGTDAINDELSRQRAISVVDMLKSRGIDTTRTAIVGRGARDPLVQTKNGVPEAKNRRVEIHIK